MVTLAFVLVGTGFVDAKPPITVPRASLSPELQLLARRAKKQFTHEDYAGAEENYRRILEKAPNNFYTLSNLGVVLFRAGQNESAEGVLKKAVAVAPGVGFSHRTLGIVYYQEGKLDEAISELRRAVAINSRDGVAHQYLGIALSGIGSNEEALKEWEKATELEKRAK